MSSTFLGKVLQHSDLLAAMYSALQAINTILPTIDYNVTDIP
jgi:hypothetical protein